MFSPPGEQSEYWEEYRRSRSYEGRNLMVSAYFP